MQLRLLRSWLGPLVAVSVVASLAACSKAADDDTGSGNDEVVSGGKAVSAETVLKSVLFVEGGCVGTKVGPKQLLVAARCVNGNATIAAGKTLGYAIASKSDNAIVANDPGADGTPADPKAKKAATKTAGSIVVESVEIHASFAAKCKAAGACAYESVDASDAPDIAVIVAKEELADVPTLPVDLDTVNAGDALLVVGTGASTFDAPKAAKATVTPSLAAPASVLNHTGSAYQKAPQFTSRENVSYVTSAGTAWKKEAPKVSVSDVGAPLVRANVAAVAGVLSNYTTFGGAEKLPVTLEHTRVDQASRFAIGDWLSKLGVATVHSCGDAKCTKHGYDGGAPMPPSTSSDGGTKPAKDGGTPPATDAGATSDAATPDAGSVEPDTDAGDAPPDESTPIPSGDESGGYGSSSDGEDDGAPGSTPSPGLKKEPSKEAPDQHGCNAASSDRPIPVGGLGLGAVVGLALVAMRRRRR